MSTPGIYPRGTHRAARVSRDARHAIRKLTRNGSSCTVCLPREFMHAMNVLPGDEIQLTYDAEWGGVFIRPAKPRPIAPAPAPPTSVSHPGVVVGDHEER